MALNIKIYYDSTIISTNKILNPKLVREIKNIDSFKFSSSEDYPLDSKVEVYFGSDKIFTGYIIEKLEKTNIYEYTVYETAYELQNMFIDYSGNYRDTWVNLSVNDIVDRILDGSGWTRISSDENNIIGEVIGNGDGTQTTFTTTLANTHIKPTTFYVYYTISGTNYTGQDDGNGNITGTNIDSGTIDYLTGDVSITFSSAPDDGTDITSDYTYYYSIPSISYEYTDKLTGLYKVLVEIRGLAVWFDNDNKYVYFGQYNNDLTASQLNYIKKTVKQSGNTAKPSKIIVLGAGDGLNQLVAERGSGLRVKKFVYKDIKTQEELDSLADQLYQKYVIEDDREIEVILDPNNYYGLMEGDLVNLDGNNYLVWTIDFQNVIKATLNREKKNIAKAIDSILRGIEPQSYFSQGITNVANFGGDEIAVDATHSAIYKFFLPDESVGTVRVNDAYVNVVGRAYRIWSKGAASGAIGENASPSTSVSESGLKILNTSGEFNTWIDIVTITPSWDKDVNFIFGEITIDTDYGNYGQDGWFYVRLYDATSGTELDKVYKYLPNIADDNNDLGRGNSTGVSVFWAGSRDSSHTYKLQVYIDKTYYIDDRFNVKGHLRLVSGHDHGNHTHNPEPGIYETDNYPSNVEVWVNGQKVADSTTHPDLAGGEEFEVNKIDIKDYIVQGMNTIEVKSDTLGMIKLDGFYRIFLSTSK